MAFVDGFGLHKRNAFFTCNPKSSSVFFRISYKNGFMSKRMAHPTSKKFFCSWNDDHRTRASDLIVIGGGLIGLSIAYESAKLGATVTVITGNESVSATLAAAGMLAPQGERLEQGPLLQLCVSSRKLYPAFVEEIERVSGLTTDFSTGGFLCPSFGNDAVSNWKPPIQGGFRQWLSQKELRIFEPLLSREVVGGWWFPEDCHINNKKLYDSLTVACKNIGVQFIRSFVDNLIYSNNILSKLRLSTGEVVAAERYVIATGCWLRKLIPLPVYPQKGQMVSLCNEKGLVPLQRVIYGDGVYIVPRKNGEIVLGATVEDHCIVDFQTSAGGIFTVLKEALRLIPSLSQLPLKQTWTGYRPTTPDLLPIFGKLWFDNVSVCAGHHRNGILLAPISGKIASRIALDITIDNSILESDVLKAFSVQRFSNMEIGDQNKHQKTEELESSVENGVEQHKLQSSVSPNERKDNTVKSGQKDQAQVSEVKLWQVDQNGQLIPIYYRRPPSNLFGSEGYGDFEEQIPTISTEGGHSSNGSVNGVVATSENRKQSTFEKDSSATEWSRSTDAYLDISSGVDDENNERELRKAILANLRFHEANTESTEHSLDAGFMQSFTNESSQPYEEDELEENKVTDEYNEWLKFYETVDTSQNIPC